MCPVHQKRADAVHDGWFSCYFELPFRWFQLSILPPENRSRVRLTLYGSLRKVNLSFGQKRLSFGQSLTIGNIDVTWGTHRNTGCTSHRGAALHPSADQALRNLC